MHAKELMYMTKCKCYHVLGGSTPVAVCYGTRECEQCWCNGYEENCTYYPEKRKKVYNTAEMWFNAQTDGKTYECKKHSCRYNKEKGFFTPERMIPKPASLSFPEAIDAEWIEVQDKRVMTIGEAEKEFDIIIDTRKHQTYDRVNDDKV